MTVLELILWLEEQSKDHRVFVDGYEDGVQELTHPYLTEVRLRPDSHQNWWSGTHSEKDTYLFEEGTEPERVVLLPRGEREE